MSLLQRLTLTPARRSRVSQHRTGAEVSQHDTSAAVQRPPPLYPAAPADAPAPPSRCGWFESSHELQAGLLVTEHREFEPVVHQILSPWWPGGEPDAPWHPARPSP